MVWSVIQQVVTLARPESGAQLAHFTTQTSLTFLRLDFHAPSPSQPLPCFTISGNGTLLLSCSNLGMMFGYFLVIIPPPSPFLIPEHRSSLPIGSSLTQLTPSSSPHHLWLWLVQQSPCQYPCSYPPLLGLHSAARESLLHHKYGHVTPTCLGRGPHSFHGPGDPLPPPCQPRLPCSSSLFPVVPEFQPQGVSQLLGNIHPFLPQCLCISCASAWNVYLEATLFRCHFLNQWKPLEQSLQIPPDGANLFLSDCTFFS